MCVCMHMWLTAVKGIQPVTNLVPALFEGSFGRPVISPPPRFNGHFPGEPGLAGFTEAKDDESGGDN